MSRVFEKFFDLRIVLIYNQLILVVISMRKLLLIEGYEGNRNIRNFRNRDYYQLLDDLGIEKNHRIPVGVHMLLQLG